MNPQDIRAAELADLGRFIASRTANTQAAAIARSTTPQLRYDAVVMAMAKDPGQAAAFAWPELVALIDRIEDPDRRAAALRDLPRTEGAVRPLAEAERQAYAGAESVDVAICSRGLWYYGDSYPTAEDPTGLEAAQFVQDEGGAYIPLPDLR